MWLRKWWNHKLLDVLIVNIYYLHEQHVMFYTIYGNESTWYMLT